MDNDSILGQGQMLGPDITMVKAQSGVSKLVLSLDEEDDTEGGATD